MPDEPRPPGSCPLCGNRDFTTIHRGPIPDNGVSVVIGYCQCCGFVDRLLPIKESRP